MTSHFSSEDLGKHVKLIDDQDWDRDVYHCEQCDGFGRFLVEAPEGRFVTLGRNPVPAGREVYILCKHCQGPRTWQRFNKGTPIPWPRDYRANLIANGLKITSPREGKAKGPPPQKTDHQMRAANDDTIPF